MYTAELVKGKTYDVMGHIFIFGDKPKEVEQDVYEYLGGNAYFSLVKDENESSEDENEEYTAASLKKLNAEQQKDIITGFGGDLESVSNEEERIALILQLQEEQKAEEE